MTTYYVDPSGNDSTGTGTSGNPWATPWHGAAQLSGADSLIVNDGTYTITTAANQIDIEAGGISETQRTVVKAANKWGAKIVNQITPINNSAHDPAIFVGKNFVDVVGFDVSGPTASMGIIGYGQFGVASGSPAGSHIRIRDCYVHDLGQSGTVVTNGWNVTGIDFPQVSASGYQSFYNEASRCFVNNIGYTDAVGSHGIYMPGGHGICENNIVANVPGFGINFYHFPHHMTVANNLVFQCGDNSVGQGGGIFFSSASIALASGDEVCDHCTCNNNIIVHCQGYAGIYEYNTPAGSVANNTFSNNAFFGNACALGNFQSDVGSSDTNEVPLLYTSASGADTFVRANQSGWGTASNGEVWSNTGDTAHLVLSIVSNQGKVTGSADDNYILLGSRVFTDIDATVRVSTSASNVNNWQGIVARYVSTGSNYFAYLRGTNFTLERTLGGAGGHAILATVAFTQSVNTEYKIHFNITGTTLSANAWLASSSEPAGWMLQHTDPNFASGQVGIVVSPDVTGTTAVYDSFTYSGTAVSEQDPLFVNYQADGSGDYHLQTGSPYIDAGTSTAAPPDDFAGTLRSLKASMDIGPYIYLLNVPVALFPTVSRRSGQLPTIARRSGVLPTRARRSGVTPTVSRRAGAFPSTKRRGE